MLFYGDSGIDQIDSFCKRTSKVANTTDMHIVVVSHVKRVNRPLPKDRDGNIVYPYWQTVMKEDGRGAGSIEQCAFNIIVLEPQITDEYGNIGLIRSRVVKGRKGGKVGLADQWVRNPETGRLQVIG